MKFVDEIRDLLCKISDLSSATPLNENCYFLDADTIYQGKRNKGHSRYPYSQDGLTLWAYDSGYFSINESNFFLVPQTLEGKEPWLAFWGGIKDGEEYVPYSITGTADTYESHKLPRHVIYKDGYAIYIKEAGDITFALKVSVSQNKEILYSLIAVNNSSSSKEVYLASFVNYLVMHQAFDNEETKWFKHCRLTKDGAYFTGLEDISRTSHLTNFAVIKRALSSNASISSSTSRSEFASSYDNSIALSDVLRQGRHPEGKKVTVFSETSAFSDVVSVALKPGESFQIDYKTTLSFDENNLNLELNKPYEFGYNDATFASEEAQKVDYFASSSLKIEFEGNEKLNLFLGQVKKQVDYCTKAKNSSLSLLGIRDIYQMMEASLLWNSSLVKERIVSCLSFFELSGRSPRQVSTGENAESFAMDNREFIDQGQWVISTIYQYLAFTGDMSLLDEECGFTRLEGRRLGYRLKERSSVLDHLKRITNYLLDKIDPETGCLRTLFGDWNDAVDGLGTSGDPNKEFGNGVSSMASFHLYRNLYEMSEIHRHLGNLEEANRLLNARKALGNAINRFVFVKDEQGSRIVHGWGENRGFYAGSPKDLDGKSRYSVTSNAFYVVSGLYEDNGKAHKDDVLRAYNHLDSKYGFKTFNECFTKEYPSIGRIINLPEGTAENAAAYIHGGIFAIRSLFLMNEGEKAWEALMKVLPYTHSYVSTSPFVMPNSYVHNDSLGLDGESMNDWYTGSSNTILKAVVFDALGIKPHIDDVVEISPVSTLLADCKVDILIKGKRFHLEYKAHNEGRLIVNGSSIEGNLIDLFKYQGDTINVEIE